MATDRAIRRGATTSADLPEVAPRLSQRTGWRPFFHRMFRRVQVRFGFVVVILFLLGTVLAPWLTSYDPIKADFKSTLQPPGGQHWLGTDNLGRDVFTRLMFGARVSLFAATVPLAISLLSGVILGLLAGTLRGWVEVIIMRLMDALLAFPSLVLMVAIAGILGPSLRNALIAIGVVGIGGVVRLVYGQTLSMVERDFILAARCLGMPKSRIMLRHILPNVVAPVIVVASLRVGGLILTEASLSFLGLGTQPPNPSWGSMVSSGNSYLLVAPWLSIVPGVAIFLVVLAVNFVGDGIRDAMDPFLIER